MDCTKALDVVEAVASGDLEVGADAQEHFQTCPRCSAALATARRIEAALAARPAPAAPARFTAQVLVRIRRERWRSEQAVDLVFNLAMVAGVVLMVGGIAALLNVSAILNAAGAAWQMLASRAPAAETQIGMRSIGSYIAAGGLLASALGMWWWADRRLSL